MRPSWLSTRALGTIGIFLLVVATGSGGVALTTYWDRSEPAGKAGVGSAATPLLPSPTELAAREPLLVGPDAVALNAILPFSVLPNPSAEPFLLRVANPNDEARALECLTQAVYYEAAWESRPGQEAVAQVVLNRVRHPVFPKSVCGVVYQGSERRTGCQFSFTCDGSLKRVPNPQAWLRARDVAARALNGYVMEGVGGATHYHADYVFPYWGPSLTKLTQLGAHIFYRFPGKAGGQGAFIQAHAGSEPIAPVDPGQLALVKDAEVEAAPPLVEVALTATAAADSAAAESDGAEAGAGVAEASMSAAEAAPVETAATPEPVVAPVADTVKEAAPAPPAPRARPARSTRVAVPSGW